MHVLGTHSACRWSITVGKPGKIETGAKNCVSGSPKRSILHTNDNTCRDFPTKSRVDNGKMRYLEKRGRVTRFLRVIGYSWAMPKRERREPSKQTLISLGSSDSYLFERGFHLFTPTSHFAKQSSDEKGCVWERVFLETSSS
ncbi:hypothetical protein NPIL_564351 [Nephila pilipes]|uniref:Uncharacterized protein n=1 Tax=Nephila pilipes TaxID=299642 RepID=A0A8X6U4A9_NEPPI|nr:hypothetical protein NPIL_564351 [Nephila pilipes]